MARKTRQRKPALVSSKEKFIEESQNKKTRFKSKTSKSRVISTNGKKEGIKKDAVEALASKSESSTKTNQGGQEGLMDGISNILPKFVAFIRGKDKNVYAIFNEEKTGNMSFIPKGRKKAIKFDSRKHVIVNSNSANKIPQDKQPRQEKRKRELITTSNKIPEDDTKAVDQGSRKRLRRRATAVVKKLTYAENDCSTTEDEASSDESEQEFEKESHNSRRASSVLLKSSSPTKREKGIIKTERFIAPSSFSISGSNDHHEALRSRIFETASSPKNIIGGESDWRSQAAIDY
eukprot:CAMPEP_0194362734 /NCGR_PEP_ID=MMETSP0174-20130528/10565_1 /TAXON_ID=216777 /ORGANISM="Proboscia alata, Strain PI-D3" /LENGTH=290 /DNA_ID=CAMNT_0039135823 /DNA_START=121 /DNA_END=993 /DNA_ORIENTATION=-